MRKLNTDGMVIVHLGEEWKHALPPCSREMTGYLENRDTLVYWFQPRGGSSASQIPALKVHGNFYHLSLRMMKCIWRNTRMRKDFRNEERGHLGGYKLRIPLPLLKEKTKTQGRFCVSPLPTRSFIDHLLHVFVFETHVIDRGGECHVRKLPCRPATRLQARLFAWSLNFSCRCRPHLYLPTQVSCPRVRRRKNGHLNSWFNSFRKIHVAKIKF